MKLQLRVALLLNLALVICSSQTWQSATVAENQMSLSITGFESAPQLGVLIAIALLVTFASNYWSVGALRASGLLSFALSAGVTLTLLGFTSSNPTLLQSRLASATGIQDWSSQLQAVSDIQTASTWIWCSVIASVLLTLWNLRIVTLKPRSVNG